MPFSPLSADFNLFMEDIALIRKKDVDFYSLLHTEDYMLTAADKSTPSAIFPCWSLWKFTLIFHLVFFLSGRTTSCWESPHHQDLSNKSLFTLSAMGSVLDCRKCKQLREGTSPGKMMQYPHFQQTGKTESMLCFTASRTNTVYIISSPLDRNFLCLKM